jgi:3'(2'), 5'-bisphosphate nucleotidase
MPFLPFDSAAPQGRPANFMIRFSTGTNSDILDATVSLTRRVGSLLAGMQSSDGLNAQSKLDGSPVTRADRAAHDMLVGALPEIAPLPVVSEESGPEESAERLRCARVWIVDPLDGTRDYLRGSSEFTVNVALVENGVPVLGVVDAPRLGLTYYAERGRGAYRIRAGGEPERIRCAAAGAADRIVVSGSDIGLDWSHVASLAHGRVEAVSSCIKLGFVADGSALAYPRLTPSSEWDIAAGHAVLLEAGGRVVGIDGTDLTYNKADPLNTSFVATGSARIAAEFASILAPVIGR